MNNPEFTTQCKQCGKIYDYNDYTFCPACFKLKCGLCGEMWVSTRYNAKESKGRMKVFRICPKCGHPDPSLIFDVEECERQRDYYIKNVLKEGQQVPWAGL